MQQDIEGPGDQIAGTTKVKARAPNRYAEVEKIVCLPRDMVPGSGAIVIHECLYWG